MSEIPGNQPSEPISTDPSQPAEQPAPPVQPYAMPVASYAAATYPPPKKGSSALKIVLIILGIFVGLGILAASAGGFFLYKFMKSSHMTASTQPLTETDLGVPLYPGAVQGKANVRMTIAGKDMLTANFLTSDPKEQVIQFYQSNLGSYAQTSNGSRGESFIVDKGAGDSVIVTIQQNPTLAGGQTQIVIIRATKAESPSN